MNGRRWLAVILGMLVLAGAAVVYALPELVRRVAVARIHAATERPVGIDSVDVSVLTGRVTLRGVRLAERDGHTPFADVGRLHLHLRLASLLRGHLRFHEITVADSTVRVVRLSPGTFNFSDLVARSGTPGEPIDVTVDRFVVTAGTVTLEDRALPEPKTWASERIEIDARGLSTRQGGGRAVARSVTAGAPVAIEVDDLRLHPIHLRARVTMEGLDLALARLYFPPDAAVIPARGRLTSTLAAVLDAREGLRADMTGRFEDLALTKPDGGEPLAIVPDLTTHVTGLTFDHAGALRVGRLAIAGTMSVRDPSARAARRFQLGSVRASVADLTWPAVTPGRLEVSASIPGGGTLVATGLVRPPPDPTELRVRLTKVDLAAWAQFVPTAARITGLAEADLRMNEPLAAGVPARVDGTIAVSRLGVADARRELLGARRLEASGLTLHWPTRLVVERLLVSDPRGIVERDRSGAFPLMDLVSAPASGPPSRPAVPAAGAASFGVDVGAIDVKNGLVAWRDEAVSPPARLDVSGIDATVSGIGWPLRGPVRLRADVRPPGGGRLQVAGQVGLDPPSADVRVVARNAELAPYRPYLPTTALVSGTADLDAAIAVPSFSEGRATARGRAALSRLDVRDGERTVMRVERATATGIDVDWPERVTVDRVALDAPWVLVERDEQGALPLRTLITTRASATRASATRASATRASAAPRASAASESAPAPAASARLVAVALAHLTVTGGGVRIVDRAVSPPFAVDLQSAAVTADGLATAAAKPARVEMTGRLGPGAELALRGTVGPLGGPLRLDVNGELREFALPRTNPYLVQQAGWKTTAGRLTSKLQVRVDGDALAARTDIRLSRLQLVRAEAHDGAQARLGLPLGVITSLMKNSRGDINLSLPVGGRLNDPRFDVSEAIWGAVRAVAIKAVTLPVSWIGRVRFTPDSRIERIEVDPVTFEPGTPTFTPEGRAQVTRLAAFLDQLPEVRLSLTPVVSSRDVGDPKRPAVEPKVLAGQRVKAVKGTLAEAGIDGARLPELPLVQRDGAEGQVAPNVLEPEAPRPSKVREVLRRLGMPLGDRDAEE